MTTNCQYEIRSIEPRQYSGLKELVNESWRTGYSKFLNEPFVRYPDIEAVAQDAQKNCIYVMTEANTDEIIGSIQLNPSYEDGTYGGGLCIHPDYQHANLSQRLIHHIEKESRKLGKNFLYGLVIECATSLRRYYASLGFVETNRKLPPMKGFEERLKPDFKGKGNLIELKKTLPIPSKL